MTLHKVHIADQFHLKWNATYYTEIIESPSNVTVFINKTAVFTCVIHGPYYWRVNGTSLGRLPSDISDDLGTYQETDDNEKIILTIPGRAEYNGTRVQCVVVGGNDSENVTLTIQGIIDILASILAVSVMLCWGSLEGSLRTRLKCIYMLT